MKNLDSNKKPPETSNLNNRETKSSTVPRLMLSFSTVLRRPSMTESLSSKEYSPSSKVREKEMKMPSR